MSDNPAVSIIVPLYNKAPYVEQCLYSLMDQTLQDIEVIVVDDGSTDRGNEIAYAICEEDERFTYAYQENAGVSSALNQGLARARGSFVARLDGDDWLDSDALTLLHHAATALGVVHVRCGYVRERAGKTTQQIPCCASLEQHEGMWCLQKLFGEIFVPFMSTCLGIYHRETLRRANILFPPELTNLEDIYFNARFFALNTSIALVPECPYHYRESKDSLSQKPSMNLPAQLGMFELLVQRGVLKSNPHLRMDYAHYRAIALLTTAADLSVYKTKGMRALKQSGMYRALCADCGTPRPLSLRKLMMFLNRNHYWSASVYARILHAARALRRTIKR